MADVGNIEQVNFLLLFEVDGSARIVAFIEQVPPTVTVDPLSLLSVVSNNNQITLTFNRTPVLTGIGLLPSGWSISPTLTILSVSVIGNTIVLNTTEQIDGISYDLIAPSGSISTVEGLVWTGPFDLSFTGSGANPTIINIYVIDARTIDVSYSEAVYPPDALTKENYTINNGLIVYAVEKISETTYRLITSKQAVGVTYLVTVSNVRDLNGNYT